MDGLINRGGGWEGAYIRNNIFIGRWMGFKTRGGGGLKWDFWYLRFLELLGQTNLISGSTDFFQNLKGRSEKEENKKNAQFFALALIINKNFL